MDKGHSGMNKRKCSCKNRVSKKTGTKYKSNTHYDKNEFSPWDFSGFTDNLNSKLLKHKDCKLEVYTIEGCKIKGKIAHVGRDYVDIKSEDGDIVTVMKDKIVWIDWLSHNCRSDCKMKKHREYMHDKKHCHKGCQCWKHSKKSCDDDHDWWNHDEKYCHDDHKWWKHEKKDWHDNHDCWKHDEKHYHDDHKWWKCDKKDWFEDYKFWKHHSDESSMW